MSFDVRVEIARGERTIAARFAGSAGTTLLVGRSGAGKTSVLQALAGLLRPTRGHIRLGGETLFDAAAGIDVPAAQRRAGYVFQEARLFPHLKVRENLLYGAGGDASALAATAEMLGISDLLARWPRTLSGGEVRRVAIGRALLARPRFLLLDEPTASLDPARRADVLRIVERVEDELRLPIVMVTHDPAEMRRIGGLIVRMD